MKKIIDFCKEKYKILIPIMVVIVLLITLIFLYREYKYDNQRNKKEVDVLQYFGGVKNEYTAIITYNLKGAIVNLNSKNRKIQYDASPVYYKDNGKILFPKDMTIVFPLKDGSQYKLFKYAEYENVDGVHQFKIGTGTYEYSYFFLYDGDGIYFFPDEVTLKINDKDYMKLGAGSYVSYVGGYTLVYYDTITSSSDMIELDKDVITVYNDYLNVCVSENYTSVFEKKVLLFNPYNLNAVSKTN